MVEGYSYSRVKCPIQHIMGHFGNDEADKCISKNTSFNTVNTPIRKSRGESKAKLGKNI